MIKPVLSERTVNKIEIMGSDYLPTLLEVIDIEQLPVQLGGKCTECKGQVTSMNALAEFKHIGFFFSVFLLVAKFQSLTFVATTWLNTLTKCTRQWLVVHPHTKYWLLVCPMRF